MIQFMHMQLYTLCMYRNMYMIFSGVAIYPIAWVEMVLPWYKLDIPYEHFYLQFIAS